MRAFGAGGTVNTLWLLGDDLLVRVPRLQTWAESVAREQAVLRRVGPALPVRVPEPLALGAPDAAYPCPWSVVRLIEGDPIRPGDGDGELAREVAEVVSALHALDTADAPAAFRTTLAARDEAARGCVDELGDTIDGAAALAAWERALSVPECELAARTWIHSDLIPPNVLVRDGRLAALIDWNGSGLGDPAVDLVAAWSLFGPAQRDVFRRELEPTDEEWERGRGWALSQGLIALPYYRDTNPTMRDFAQYVLAQILA